MSSHTVEDSFNRADSPTSLGTTDGGDTPKLWGTDPASTWGLDGNQACVKAQGAGDESFALVSLAAEVFTAQARLATIPASAASVGLVVRYSSTTNYIAFICDTADSGQLKLLKQEAGVGSLIGGPYASVSDGDTIGVAGFTIGTDHYLELFRNGSFVADVISPFNTSAFRHGLYSLEGDISPTGRFDDFIASYDDAIPDGGDGEDAGPCITVVVGDFVADGATPDTNGIIYTVEAVDGWYDSIPLRSGTAETQPRGETITVAQELGRTLDVRITAHTTGGLALGAPLCFAAMEAIKTAFRAVYVPVLFQVIDPFAIGGRQLLARRVGPIKQAIVGDSTAVQFSIPMLGEDPRRFDSP